MGRQLSNKGIAFVIVVIMASVFTLLAAGILFYAGSNASLGFYEVRKMKAYYVAEAGFLYGVYRASSWVADGSYPWQLQVGQQSIPVTYTLTTNADQTKTVSSTVSNMKAIKVSF